jgi:hypothetical protein
VAEEQLREILEVIQISQQRELFQSTFKQKRLMEKKLRFVLNALRLKTKKHNVSILYKNPLSKDWGFFYCTIQE